MKKILSIIIYLIILLILESIIVSVFLNIFYKDIEGCPWYIDNISDYFIRYLYLKIPYLIIFLIPYLWLFRNFMSNAFFLTYINLIAFHFLSFLGIQIFLIALFQRGGLEMGLPACVNLGVKYLIVVFAVAKSLNDSVIRSPVYRKEQKMKIKPLNTI